MFILLCSHRYAYMCLYTDKGRQMYVVLENETSSTSATNSIIFEAI